MIAATLPSPASAARRLPRPLPRLVPAAAVPVLLLLALWQAACASGLFPEQVLVPPLTVARTLLRLTASGELTHDVAVSLWRLLLGFAAGALAGLGFGAVAALSGWAEAALWPLFLALWQVPVIAFLPVLVLFLGIDETFKVTMVALATFFPVALATFDGIRALPRAWFEVARVYRTRPVDLAWRILVPATVPAVLTGLRVAITRAWVVLVAAELLAADSGIGQLMETGRQLFQIDAVLAGVVVSGVIGFLLDRSARALERRATRWRTA